MSDDLAEFLRRAAQKRAAQAGPPSPRPPRPVQPTILEPADVEIIEAEPVSGDDVAALVAAHLDTSDIAQHASQLGRLADQADQRREPHVQHAFDHQLGSLGRGETPADTADGDQESPAGAAAQQIIAMLQDPASIRTAIVLREVLDRPEHRWQ